MSAENDTPVLTDVVRRGDEDLIKAARLEREIFDELNRMAPRERNAAPPNTSDQRSTAVQTPDSSLEQAVDSIVRFHSEAMREDLLTLLRERTR